MWCCQKGKYEKGRQSGVGRSWVDWVEILDRDTFKLGLVGGVGVAIGFVRKLMYDMGAFMRKR